MLLLKQNNMLTILELLLLRYILRLFGYDIPIKRFFGKIVYFKGNRARRYIVRNRLMLIARLILVIAGICTVS